MGLNNYSLGVNRLVKDEVRDYCRDHGNMSQTHVWEALALDYLLNPDIERLHRAMRDRAEWVATKKAAELERLADETEVPNA